MLLVLGASEPNAEMFVHSNGNINGNYEFFGDFGSLTILGNSEVRGSYAGWDASVIAEFESKAQSGEIVPSITDSNFNIEFAAVPEPSSTLLGLLGVCSLLLRRRR